MKKLVNILCRSTSCGRSGSRRLRVQGSGHFRLGVEDLESRRQLSTLAFVAHELLVDNEVDGTSLFSVDTGDLDNDGDLDVVSGNAKILAFGNIAWYENDQPSGQLDTRHVITTVLGDYSVSAADVDRDGDLDVLAAGWEGITWLENIDGKGQFGPKQVIVAEFSNHVDAADLDSDGDVDVLAVQRTVDDFNAFELVWYENEDGHGTFRRKLPISTGNRFDRYDIVDLDGDGDLDILAGLVGDGIVGWYENRNGEGAFGELRVIATTGDEFFSPSALAADIDSDGDTDVLVASASDKGIAWYENVDGNATYGPQRLISNETPLSVRAADMDRDGDLDVIFTEFCPVSIGWCTKVKLLENLDGSGNFAPSRVIIGPQENQLPLHIADLDGDQDLDVGFTIADDRIAWYENRIAGDTDNDGSVDFTDFLALSANFGKEVDAVWADGDFDANGKVDFADFLTLSQNFE